MKVELLFIHGCPNHSPTLARLREAMSAEGVASPIHEIEVQNENDAKSMYFPGSPTVRVNGRDIEKAVRGDEASFACRVYRTETGNYAGLPSVDLIRQALREGAQ